jgi:hypothetical protein
MARLLPRRWTSLLPVVLVGFVLAVVEYVAYRTLDRYAGGLDSLPTVVMEEFPDIDEALLEKFSSFDSELGWAPQPNMEKQKDTGDHLPGEEVRTVVTYSTDEYGSRVCPACDRRPERRRAGGHGDADATAGAKPSRTDGAGASAAAAGGDGAVPPTVSTYGDSYCFCREVDDDETFQHYLAERLDTHVGNYGGGNYGLDQAVLRMKRQYPEDPTDYVCMVVTASSIARILSVWKHYQEFGNVLALKPRYRLEDGDLDLVECPVDEKAELLDLESKAGFLRSNDFHYDRWFLPHLATFPYSRTLLADADHVRYCAYGALKDLEAKYDRSITGVDAAGRQKDTVLRLEEDRVEYHRDLYAEQSDLFEAVVGEFVEYADEQGFTPVFAMVGQLRYARRRAVHGPIYRDLLDRLDDEYDDLVTVDVPEHFPESDDPEAVDSLYVDRGEGGHYSPETNERIADVLMDEVFE